MKELITAKTHLRAVRVPEHAYDFDFYYDKYHEVNVLEWKQPRENIGSFIKDSDYMLLEGDNEWELVGSALDITEEQCKSLVNVPKDRPCMPYRSYWLEYLKQNKREMTNGTKWVFLKKKNHV